MIKPKPLIQNVLRVQEREDPRFYKLRFDRNERTYPFSDRFINRIRERLDSEWLLTYPEPEKLYGIFSEFLKQPRDRILFNNGSDQSIKAIYETYIGKGDRILLHRPGYAMFSVYAKMFGALVNYQDFDADLNFDYEAYIDTIDGSFRMAVLESPNGFIGVAPPKEILTRFADKCEKEGVIAVVDEAYYLFGDATAQGLLDTHENLIIIRTFSKAMGIAGLRAGYTLSKKENIENLYKVKPMHEINGFAVLVLEELLNSPEEVFGFIEEIHRTLRFLKDGFAKLGIDTSESVANFLAARIGKYIPVADLTSWLKGENILIRRSFRERHLSEWARIGCGSMLQMQKLLDVIAKNSDIKKRNVQYG